MDEKKEFRRELRKCWESLNDRELKNLSLATEQTVQSCREWDEAEMILAYLSFGREISLDSLIRKALEEKKEVYVPLIKGPGKMDFHRISALENLTRNRWGIREPSPDTDVLNLNSEKKGLILTPGLGFSPDGRRMGRGGGFYDRFLARCGRKLKAVGICWEGVFREDLPVEEHDLPVDLICCGDRLIRPRKSD